MISHKNDYKAVFANFSALSILQISNYILPMITIPYIVRIISPEKFGLINFIAAIFGYFQLVLDYGFYYSATRKISILRNEKEKLDDFVSTIFMIKFLIFLVGVALLIIVFLIFQISNENVQISVLTLISVVSISFFPIWYFQGIEKMSVITGITILAKTISLILIFGFISQPEDYILYVAINSFSSLLVFLISLGILIFMFGYKFRFPQKSTFVAELVESWQYFITNLGINLYTTSNVVILGFFTNNTIVGYWVGIDKIRMAIQGIMGVFSQSVFPRVSLLLDENLQNGIEFVKKIASFGGSIALIISIITFFFSSEIVSIVLGSQYSSSANLLKMISFLPFIIFFSNIFGIQLLINLNRISDLMKIVLSAAVMNLILSFIFVPKFQAYGTAFSVLITEICVTIFAILVYYKKETVES